MVFSNPLSAERSFRLSSNHKSLYQFIRMQGSLARADLVRVSGLTFPSVSRMVAELLDADLIQETQQRRGGMGKPPTELALRPERALSLGFAFGGNRVQAVLIDALGTVQNRTELEATPDTLADVVKQGVAQLGEGKSNLVGLGVIQSGAALSDAQRDALHGALGLPVVVTSQAGAGAILERYFGAAQKLDSFIYLNAAATLTSAVMLGERLLAQPTQLEAAANVLGGELSADVWTGGLPLLTTALLTAQQFVEPAALILGGDDAQGQIDTLASALKDKQPDSSAPLPVLQGIGGDDRLALAAATLPLYERFAVTSKALSF